MQIRSFFKSPLDLMKKVGQLAVQLLRKDTQEGVFQNGKKDHYRSEQYKKYKSLGMQRLTLDTGKSALRNKKRGGQSQKTDLISKGRRLKAYTGQTIDSRNVSYVDLTLTGRMLKGLHIENPTDKSVDVSFDPQDAGKVLGAEKYGRHVLGLSDENLEKIRQYIAANIEIPLPKEINFKIKI